MRAGAVCAASAAILVGSAASGATLVSPGESFDLTFGVASSAGAIGVTTVALAFDPSQPQLLTNPGGYGFFGDLRFDYFETDLGGGMHTISLIITTADSTGFVPGGLTIGGAPVSTMFFDIGDFFTTGAFADGISVAPGFSVESTNFGYFVDGSIVAGPFGLDDSPGDALFGQASISTNDGSDIGVYGINGFRIDWNLAATAVPLPASGAIGLAGLACVAGRRRRG
ncbi:MAG: hypothetical protein ACF8QF_14450 [Phycisphaerales bacterium]